MKYIIPYYFVHFNKTSSIWEFCQWRVKSCCTVAPQLKDENGKTRTMVQKKHWPSGNVDVEKTALFTTKNTPTSLKGYASCSYVRELVNVTYGLGKLEYIFWTICNYVHSPFLGLVSTHIIRRSLFEYVYTYTHLFNVVL